jgi:hypothetical protein
MAVNQTGSSDPRQRRRDAASQPSSDYAGMGKAPEGSFKFYKAVPGKPGFFDDGFGHLKYIPPASMTV